MNWAYQYDATELAAALWQIEDELQSGLKSASSKHVRILLIGGGAIALGYGAAYGTVDIDTMEAEARFLQAWAAVSARTSKPLPALHEVAVADAPINFEDRLQRIQVLRPGSQEKMACLQIDVPERHDLAMMKIVRGEERDSVGLSALHEAQPLDPARLIELYRTEMKHIVGNMKDFRLKFLHIFSVLFGKKAAEQLAPRLPVL